MKSKFFIKSCLLLLLMACVQAVWAAPGDRVLNTTTEWDKGALNSISGSNFVKKTTDELVKITITGDHKVSYTSTYDAAAAQGASRLTFGSYKQGQRGDFEFYWTPTDKGYEVHMKSIRCHFGMAGFGCHYQIGDGEEVNWTASAGQTISLAPKCITWDAASLPFHFRRSAGAISYDGFITKIQMEYFIVPDAPKWKQDVDTMYVTVDAEDKHWYSPADCLDIIPLFKTTTKYEFVGDNSRYVEWNEDHTKFWVTKPGIYKVRAYTDKYSFGSTGTFDECGVSGVQYELGIWSASDWCQEHTVVAVQSPEDIKQGKNKFWVYVGGKLANETDVKNHYWDINLPTHTETDIEFFTANSTDPITLDRMERYMILSNLEPTSAHVTTLYNNGTDTLTLTQGSTYAFVRFHIAGASVGNHVPFTINSYEYYDTIVTYTNNASWDGSKIVFSESAKTTDERYVDLTFTGVPDSLYFLYKSLSTNANSHLTIYFASDNGGFVKLAEIHGQTANDPAKAYAFNLLPSTRRLKFNYTGCTNSGYLQDVTVSERKEIDFVKDTLVITGVHKQGGVATAIGAFDWYNIRPNITLNVEQRDAAKFALGTTSFTSALDKYGMNNTFDVTYKLDEPGIHYTYVKATSGDYPAETSMMILKGITKYDKGELEVKVDLPSDTVAIGEKIDNPFSLQDTTGNPIQSDSIKYNYTSVPSSAVEFDENGNFKPLCCGLISITATTVDNSLIPQVAKTIKIFVPEKSKNAINWHLPAEVGVHDQLVDVISSNDSDATITYSYTPQSMMKDLGYGSFKIGDKPGTVTIYATASKTCDHFAVSDSISFNVKGVVGDVEPDQRIKESDVQVGDTLRDIIKIKDEKGNILDSTYHVYTTYRVEPPEAARILENGTVIILDESGDIMIIAKTWGDTIKTRYDTMYINVKRTQEAIYGNLPDTIFLSSTYMLKDYFTTRSGLGIDSAWVNAADASKASINLSTFEFKPLTTGTVAFYVRAKGNKHWVGPVREMHSVVIVSQLKPIDWPVIKDDIYVGDTIPTGDVKIYDEKGNDITDKVKIDYIFDPEDGAHVDEKGNVVVDKDGDIQIITVVSGDGIETVRDTMNYNVKQYGSIQLIWPGYVEKDNIFVGDTIAQEDFTVLDGRGKDITSFVLVTMETYPKDAAHTEFGDLIFDKAGEAAKIVATVSGEGLATMVEDTLVSNINKYQDSIPQPLFPTTMTVGDTIPVPTTTLNGVAITYTSSDPTKVKYENGNLICLEEAKAVTLTASTAGTEKYEPYTTSATFSTKDKDKQLDQIDLSMLPDTIYVGQTVRMDQNSVIGKLPVTYVSSNTSMVTVNGNVITAVAASDSIVTISAGTNGDQTYSPAYAYKQVRVLRYDDMIDLTKLPDTLYVGESVVMPTKSIIGQLDVTYISGDGSVITVNGNILTCTAFNAQPIVITGQTAGDAKFNPATDQKTVVVSKKQDKIDLSMLPDTLTVGQSYTLGISSVYGNLEVTYVSDEENVVVKGNVITVMTETVLPVVISASTLGDNYYLPATAKKTVFIKKSPIKPVLNNNFLIQLWDDVLAINLDSLYKFAGHVVDVEEGGYYWYTLDANGKEVMILRATGSRVFQDINGLNGTYYVKVVDKQGNQYQSNELVIIPNSNARPAAVRVYPTYVSASDDYTVEAPEGGKVYVVSSEGNPINNFQVETGVNSASAPSMPGVYVVNYISKDGSRQTCKLIVK